MRSARWRCPRKDSHLDIARSRPGWVSIRGAEEGWDQALDRGIWGKVHEKTLEGAVLTLGWESRNAVQRSQGLMPPVCPSLRDNKVLATGTPVSQGLGSSGKVGELRPEGPLSKDHDCIISPKHQI